MSLLGLLSKKSLSGDVPDNKVDKKEGGFTIVEVMIVLAIAGLVLAIVFIAVPALRRNSNNAGRSADVGQIGTAISNYSANRNGQLPAALGDVTHVSGNELGWSYYEFDGVTPTATTAAVAANVGTQAEDDHRLTYFATATGGALADTSLTFQALPSPDEVHVWSGYKCLSTLPSAGNPEAVAAAATAVKYGTTAIEAGARRDVAIVYQLEGQATALCLDDV